MNALRQVPAVFLFEWRRLWTIPRLGWMVVLTAFPACLLLIVRFGLQEPPPIEGSLIVVYVLSACLATMLSVLLSATPVIASELEGRSWVYLVVRPHGAITVLLGKYLVSVSAALPVAMGSAILATLAFAMDVEPLEQLAVMLPIVILSCLSYSALYLLLGVISPKRAMVFALAYTIIVELLLAFVPAVVNQLTLQYRLRCILVRWSDLADISRSSNAPYWVDQYFGNESGLFHVFAILGITLGLLALSAVILRFREFTFASETDS
jgi:ABC-type transport system involved in multi-copper enzyme maturation permease subunit